MRKLFLILMSLLACGLSALAQTATYHGTVLDAETNEPLIGVTVMPIGGGQGVATDLDGNFKLTVPKSVKQVKVSYVGMETVTVPLTDNMVVKMKTAGTDLSDLVVIGYGSARKLGSVVGSVSVVGDKVLENSPTATFIDALQGQVPGLNIYSNSGDPSSVSNSVNIRGISSLNAGTTPLYILDGAPISQQIFTTLNPDDIQNITVLKDAASVSIYGSRAANGVIVITSKKGTFGMTPKLTVRANYGWSQMVEDNVEMMNSAQYIEFRNKIGSPVPDDAREAWEKYGISTNWRDVTFDSSAPTYSVNAALTGGGEMMSYYMSLDHYDAEGIITSSGMRRETLRVNLNAKLNDWFRVGIQSNLGYTKYDTNAEASASDGIYTTNPMVFARIAYPYDSPYYYTIGDNGQPVYGDKAMKLRYSELTSPDFNTSIRDTKRTRVTANINMFEQITPIPGLIIKAQQAVDAYDYRLSNKNLPYYTFSTPMGSVIGSGQVGALNTGTSQETFERFYAWTYTNTAEYSFNLKDIHNFIILAGQESIFQRTNGFGAYSQGHTDQRLMLLNQGTSVLLSNLSESMITTTFNSYFIKAEYNFDSRYFLEASFRRDGSSKFAPGHRWSNFFSVGGMWNAKNEKFLNDVTWLNEAQIHTSYGTTGNTSIDDYMFFGSVSAYAAGYGPDDLSSATTISRAPNHSLTWETVRSFDLGLRLRFIDRILFEPGFYHKTTKDMLMNIPWSFTTGFSGGWGNIGSMNNTGFDFNLIAEIIKSKDWNWTVRANFNYNHNRITELFNGRDSYTLAGTGTRYEVGHSAGEFYTVRYLGVDPADGKQVWLDKNDNPTKVYNEEENAVMTGKSLYAPLTGGFGTNLSWKGLALQVDFNWAAKKYMTNNDAFFLMNAAMGGSQNQAVEMLNVWTKPGDVTIYPNATETIQFDSRLLEDASFLRLKALTLSYALPKNILDKINFNKVLLHFTGRNLWTLTKFNGYDPEPQYNVIQFRYPNTRQYEFGIEVTI